MKKDGEREHPVGMLEAKLEGMKAENYVELSQDVKAQFPEADKSQGENDYTSPRCVRVKQGQRKTTIRETIETLRKGAEAEQKANFSIATTARR